MSLLRKKPAELTARALEDAATADHAALPEGSAGKGRPTPKRREAERRRGPVAPPPRTQREAYKRTKKTGGPKLTKDERREMAGQRRERMMSGDDAYLLPRDKGAVRAYVRDLVDTRRNLAGLLLPIAVLSFLTLAIPTPAVANLGPLILMVMILAAVADSVMFGRRMTRKIAVKFPKGDKSGQSLKGAALGFYAFNRACLVRKWRIPRPRVERGGTID
ncbi:MAG: DUF3043 domain-containing protein [Nakamurella sp.]